MIKPMLYRVDVFRKISAEREYQQRRWPAPTPDELDVCLTQLDAGAMPTQERWHEVGAWISFMETYLQEARNINSKSDDVKGSLVKILNVAALAVACLEQHGCPERDGGVSVKQSFIDQMTALIEEKFK